MTQHADLVVDTGPCHYLWYSMASAAVAAVRASVIPKSRPSGVSRLH